MLNKTEPTESKFLQSNELSLDRLARLMYSSSLTYFIAVADALSIRGAARRLNLAPSALNRQIQRLEHVTGTKLFERTGRSLTMTAAGEVLLRHAHKTLTDLRATIAEIDAVEGQHVGVIRIASIESFAGGLLSSIVTEFSARHPLIHVVAASQPSQTINRLVSEGNVDIGFTINPPISSKVRIVEQYDLPVGAVVSPDHPLAKRKNVTVAECLAFPLVLWKSLMVGELFDLAVASAHAPRQTFIEANSTRLASTLARNKKFVAFVHALGIEQELRDGSLVLVPFAEPRLRHDSFAAITNPNAYLRPAPAAFLKLSQEMIESHRLFTGGPR